MENMEEDTFYLTAGQRVMCLHNNIKASLIDHPNNEDALVVLLTYKDGSEGVRLINRKGNLYGTNELFITPICAKTLWNEVDLMLREILCAAAYNGKKIAAIKWLHSISQMTLIEAKTIIEDNHPRDYVL